MQEEKTDEQPAASLAVVHNWFGWSHCVMLYNVHMRKYSVSMVRERLSEALDDADRGEPVFIERRGVTYELAVRKAPSRRKKATPQIEILDPAIVEGNWTWEWEKGDLQLRTRRS